MNDRGRPAASDRVVRCFVAIAALGVCATPRDGRAQDTSAIDRGVRIGIVYRPGVRPGLVVLPGPGTGLDSVRTIVQRDLDHSDRFEVITLPGAAGGRAGGAGGGGDVPLAGMLDAPAGSGGARVAGLNYPLLDKPKSDQAHSRRSVQLGPWLPTMDGGLQTLGW